MSSSSRGVVRRLMAGVAVAATAVAGLSVGLTTPAHAAPVAVTTTLTDAAGNALDGYVDVYRLEPSGYYSQVDYHYAADGIVSLALEPGTYKLRFADEEGRFKPEFYTDKPDLATADPIAVSGPTPLAPVVLAQSDGFTGTVVSPSGKPLFGARVYAYSVETGAMLGSARTDRSGAYLLGLVPGVYKLEYSASGYSSEFYNNKASIAAADPVTVTPGVTPLEPVTLSRGAVITGRVINSAGLPLELVQVQMRATNGVRTLFASTDSTGVFRLENVIKGTYEMRFSDPLGEYVGESWNDVASSGVATPIEVPHEGTFAGFDPVLADDPNRRVVDQAAVDIAGRVTDSAGAPVVGASVTAYDTPADKDEPQPMDVVKSNRAGYYYFEDLSLTSETAFKLHASDAGQRRLVGAYDRLPRFLGGAQAYAGAATVTRPDGAANITLPLTGGISGVVTSESSLPVNGVSVTFHDEDAAPGRQYGSASVKEDGTYASTTLAPGKYKVYFSEAEGGAGVYREHAPEWFSNTTRANAKVVRVSSGRTTGGINAKLSERLSVLRRPEVRGAAYIGGKVRAYPGVWSVSSGTTYTYEWLVNNTVVATGSSLKVTRKLRNKRLTLRVVAGNDGLHGIALVSTQKIRVKPRVRVKIAGKSASITISGKKVKAKKIKGKVVAKRIVRKTAYGAPVYKVVGKAKVRNGRAVVRLGKLKKGKNKVVFLITLPKGKLGGATVTRTVKVG